MENDFAFEDEFDFTPETSLSQTAAARKMRRWREENSERAKLRWRIDRNNQRARRMGCEGVLTIAEWLMLCALYGGRCVACGRSEELEIDHIVPLEQGGANTRDNTQPLCATCNKVKGRQVKDYRTAQALRGGAGLMNYPATVELTGRFYYCLNCGVEHEYREELFQFHQAFAKDFGRWAYEEKP
jgi:5-methylcytosine-specific restriction endonuclease McrA